MSSITRRLFVAESAAAGSLARALLARERFGPQNLGVQLYTVRNIIEKDPLSTLRRIQEIGYKEIEGIYASIKKIWPSLKQTSLRPVSIHMDEQLFMERESKLDTALGEVKKLGFSYVVVPYIPPEHRGGAEMFERLADTLNKAGERAHTHGLKLCYHNHAFEFQSLGEKTGLQMLMSGTDKKLVFLELDVFWASVAGHNPVELLKLYSGRVPLVHLKDKSASFHAVQYNEKVPNDTFEEVGSGSIDIPGVLKAAEAAGVMHYFVEQDQTPGDPLDSLEKSFRYLSSHFGKV